MENTKDYNFVNKHLDLKSFRKEILEALPFNLRELLIRLPSAIVEDIEEIRLRINQPFILSGKNKDFFVNEQGELVNEISMAYKITTLDLEKSYQIITDYSVYALEEEIRNGFITIKGGHRVGICGKAVLKGKDVQTIKNISGLSIRISKQKLGTSDKIMEYLIDPTRGFLNTLIISPPQCGKTTLLRDIIRNLSNGMRNPAFKGLKVGVVDERSEICGVYQGIPQNDVGIRTDMLDACPKAEGIMMLIRSMSPQVIATDEIGKEEDALAVEEALNAGIKLITTVHGSSLDEICRRPNVKALIHQHVFERIIVLSNLPKVGTVRTILNGKTNSALYSYKSMIKGCEVFG